MLRRILRGLLKAAFGFEACNAEVLKSPGPLLLVPNHVSWLDWLFLYTLLDLDWKFVVSRQVARRSPIHRLLVFNRRTFPIDNNSASEVRRLAEFLRNGGRLVLFAEGQISRTGTLMKLYEGAGLLLHASGARVAACYLRGAERLKWSRQPGWRRWFPKVSAHFSGILAPPSQPGLSAAAARSRLTNWLRDRMVELQFRVETAHGPRHLLEAVTETAAQIPGKTILQDAAMRELSYRRLLAGAELLAGRLERRLRDPGRPAGVLLPASNAAPIVFLALWSLGRAPVALNFSLGAAVLCRCLELAGLRQVITSRRFLEAVRLDPAELTRAGAEVICLEDLQMEISAPAKALAWLRCAIEPRRLWRLRRKRPDAPPPGPEETAVIVFTSGSEGDPKGVRLTHGNILANVRQLLAVVDVTDRDRIFNVLPIFHSFGFTVGVCAGLIRGIYTFQYPSPLHYRLIPALFYDRHCTVLVGANTFLRGYASKAHPYDFHTLRLLFAGAEKVREDTARLWAQKFGVRILEGYGVTECSPVVSVNTPMAPRHGSAGRFLPGIEWRLEPVEGVSEGGRLWVRGPNVMAGYLQPEADARFRARAGWHDTGDIAAVDEEGFLYIKGRARRFAKVGGEMVSLAAVEESLAEAFAHLGPEFELAVLSRRDARRGETLVAVVNSPEASLEAMRDALKARGFSNLWIPREVICAPELPKLAAGKIAYPALERMLERRRVSKE